MTNLTTNMGLEKDIGALTDGQENKIAALNQQLIVHGSNLDIIDSKVPLYMGEFGSQPASGTAPVGSVYLNNTDNKMYVLTGKAPDTYVAFISGAPVYLGDQASDPSSTNPLGSRYYDTVAGKFKTHRSTGVWTAES